MLSRLVCLMLNTISRTAPLNDMKSAIAVFLSLAGIAASTTTYACNPAHSYPNGATCIETRGTLSLVTPTTPPLVCNPAHSYPTGATCINGTLSYITPTPTPTYACNPAHSYPNGATYIATCGSLSLVTPYPCNPAHSYPSPATCTASGGSY